MEKFDIERYYWFTVQDCAEILSTSGTDIETFMGDVFDSVLKLDANANVLPKLMAILDQLSQQRDIDNANQIAKQILAP
jgi:hypothetical protein